MVKRQHKIMCLVLCLMLAVSTVFVGVVSASAATGDTVYVRVNNGWSKVNCYMWTDGLGSNASWPGKAMTKVEDGVYSYTLDNDYTSVIFNNGSDQTKDLAYPGHGKIYDLTRVHGRIMQVLLHRTQLLRDLQAQQQQQLLQQQQLPAVKAQLFTSTTRQVGQHLLLICGTAILTATVHGRV